MSKQNRVSGNLPHVEVTLTSKNPPDGALVAMERPKAVDVNAYIDNENGIYIGVRVTRELHKIIMAEKGNRQDKVTIQELAAEALVEKYML